MELTTLLAQAAAINTPVPLFDANHPSLLPAGDMPKIAALCVDAGAAAPTHRQCLRVASWKSC